MKSNSRLISHMSVSDQIALHSVQLPLFIEVCWIWFDFHFIYVQDSQGYSAMHHATFGWVNLLCPRKENRWEQGRKSPGPIALGHVKMEFWWSSGQMTLVSVILLMMLSSNTWTSDILLGATETWNILAHWATAFQNFFPPCREHFTRVDLFWFSVDNAMYSIHFIQRRRRGFILVSTAV